MAKIQSGKVVNVPTNANVASAKRTVVNIPSRDSNATYKTEIIPIPESTSLQVKTDIKVIPDNQNG